MTFVATTVMLVFVLGVAAVTVVAYSASLLLALDSVRDSWRVYRARRLGRQKARMLR